MRLFTLNYSDQWREVFWNLVSQFVRLLSFIKSQLEHELLTYKVRQWSKPPDSDKKASRECFTFASVKTSSSAVGGKRSVWPGHNSLAWRCGALPLITSLSINKSKRLAMVSFNKSYSPFVLDSLEEEREPLFSRASISTANRQVWSWSWQITVGKLSKKI